MAGKVRYVDVSTVGTTVRLQLPERARTVGEVISDPRAALTRIERGSPIDNEVDEVLLLADQEQRATDEANPDGYVVGRGRSFRILPGRGTYIIIGYGTETEGRQLAAKVLRAWLDGLDPADAKFTLAS